MTDRDTRVTVGGSPRARHLQVRRLGRNRFTAAKQAMFMAVLAETANVTMAMEAAGVTRAAVYRLRKESEAFAAAWKEALADGIEQLEMMVLERALNGTEKPVGRAEDGRTTRVFDERLILQLLKAHKPEVYGVAPWRARHQTEPMPRPVANVEEARARLLALLDEMEEGGELSDG